jgi:hypothetical protein
MQIAAVAFLCRQRWSGTVVLPRELWLTLLLVAVLGAQWALGRIQWFGQAAIIGLYLTTAMISMSFGWLEAISRPMGHGRVAAGEWLAWTLLVAGLLSLAIALIQVLDIWQGQTMVLRLPHNRRPGGNVGQPNHLATLFVMACAAVAYLQMLRRIGPQFLLLLSVLFAAGIAITESRTGLLAMVVLCVWWAWKRPDGVHVPSRFWACVPSAAAVALFVAWPATYQIWDGSMLAVAEGIERLATSTGDSRLVLWSQLLQASLIRPWFGWGLRNTAEAHNAVAHLGDFSAPFSYSHNIVLDLAIWVGWPIALFAVFTTCWWGANRIRSCSSALPWFGMGILLPFGLHSLLEFPFAYAYLLVPAMIGVGYLASAHPRARIAMPVPIAGVAILITAVIAVWSVVDYLRAEDDFRVSRFEMLRIGPPPVDPPPKLLLLGQLGDMLASSRLVLKPDMDTRELDLLRSAALHNPWSGPQYRYAHALALNGQSHEAKRQLAVLKAQHGSRVHDLLRRQIDSSLESWKLPPLEHSFANPDEATRERK